MAGWLERYNVSKRLLNKLKKQNPDKIVKFDTVYFYEDGESRKVITITDKKTGVVKVIKLPSKVS